VLALGEEIAIFVFPDELLDLREMSITLGNLDRRPAVPMEG
jgi:hypothetical protein